MARVPRHRRLFALVLIAATNIGFYTLPVRVLDADQVALLIGMVVAVTVAFVFSAFSHLIRVDRMRYRYVLSGGIGIAFGAVAYIVLKDSRFLSMEWINSGGKVVLIALNLAAALVLFFLKPAPRKD